jgi:hypothetical protein
LGFFLGVLASKTYLASDQYRALRISNLFERMCLQEFDWQAEKQRPPIFSLRSLKSKNDILLGGTEEWTDQRSKTFIKKSKKGGCSVLIREPFGANSNQASMLLEHIEAVKDRTYPNLELDPGMDAIGPYVIGWFKGSPFRPERWGIYFYGSEDGDGDFFVTLGFRPPPPEPK